MPEQAANSLSVDMLDLDETESLNLDGEKEQPTPGERKRKFCSSPVEVFNMLLSSVVLGSCLSAIGPTIPQLMKSTNVRTFSAGVNTISANAAGSMVGVLLAACWFSRRYAPAFISVCTLLCGIVTYVIPQTESSLNCLLLFFVQGILLGIIDRGRYNIGPQNLNEKCKTVLLLYLALSAGGVLPLVSISSQQIASYDDSPPVALPRLFRRQVDAADVFRNGLGFDVNYLFNKSFLASFNKVVTELSNFLNLSFTNLTTTSAPQKPKYVDGTGLKTGQTYAERKQKELKQIQAKELTTSLAPDGAQLNSSSLMNETLYNVTLAENSSIVEQSTVVTGATVSKALTTSSAPSTEPPRISTSFREVTTVIPPHSAPSAPSKPLKSFPKVKPFPGSGGEPMKSVLPNGSSTKAGDVKSLGEILIEAAQPLPNVTSAYRTAAWISIAAVAFSFISCWVLFFGQKMGVLCHDPQSFKVAELPQSQYAKAVLFFSCVFIFFVTAAEALLTCIIAIFMVVQYSTTLQDGIRLCCAVWVFLCIGRLLFLPLKNASGRYVGACMGCSLLLAAGTVFNLNQELFALLSCLFACFLGPISPLAFCWLCKETGNHIHFVTYWSIAAHFSRATVPALVSWLMDDHQARDYTFGVLSTTLAALVLLIPLDKAAKQSNQYFESVRRSGKRFDGTRVAYSKLVNRTKRDSDCDDERAQVEESSLFEI